ncbi:MAG TPA: hypothetical protein VLI06_18020 [Solimonas sp.]|nr:hypothetical protein [Solimonas sp.]
MNPIISTLAQYFILMPATLALRLLDLARPLAAGQARTAPRRGDVMLCSVFVAGWWTLITQAVQGIIGLP